MGMTNKKNRILKLQFGFLQQSLVLFNRQVFRGMRQDRTAVLLDENVILDSYAAQPGDIDARFDGDNGAALQVGII